MNNLSCVCGMLLHVLISVGLCSPTNTTQTNTTQTTRSSSQSTQPTQWVSVSSYLESFIPLNAHLCIDKGMNGWIHVLPLSVCKECSWSVIRIVY
jgi:hypothetical protein